MTYQEALDKLKGRPRRKLQNNTYLETREHAIAIRLHATDVVTLHEDGTYTLDSGGWKSVTTKDRINAYTSVNLWQEKHVWYVGGREDRYLFVDGMRLDAQWQPIDGVQPGGTAKRQRELSKLVTAYVKNFRTSVGEHGIENPAPGDCLACYFAHTPGNTKTGTYNADDSFTDTTGKADPLGVSHLLDHIDERWYVPSLLWNAIRERGYRDPALIWHLTASGNTLHNIERDLLRYFQKRYPALIEALEQKEEFANAAV
jgi:hypothetical protein